MHYLKTKQNTPPKVLINTQKKKEPKGWLISCSIYCTAEVKIRGILFSGCVLFFFLQRISQIAQTRGRTCRHECPSPACVIISHCFKIRSNSDDVVFATIKLPTFYSRNQIHPPSEVFRKINKNKKRLIDRVSLVQYVFIFGLYLLFPPTHESNRSDPRLHV